MNKIVVTGGHLTPALAVLEELNKDNQNLIHWVGYKHNQAGNKSLSAEYKIVKKMNIPFYTLKTGKLVRKWSFTTFLYGLWQFILLFVGFTQSFFIVLCIKPKLVLSFGGFLAVPIVIWAKVFGAKIVTHEQTLTLGLANKIIAKFADKILISWEESQKYFPESKTVLTGNPLRKEILNPPSNLNIFDSFTSTLPIVFITGGNQGASEINKRISVILEDLLEIANVVHQCGSREYKEFLNIKKNLKSSLKKRYIVSEFLESKEMAYVMKNSDLIVGRAGANTVTELLYLKKECILIPIPWVSHNEQYKNAKLLEDLGLAKIFEQKDENTPKLLLSAIKNSLYNKTSNLSSEHRYINENAATEIAKVVYELLLE